MAVTVYKSTDASAPVLTPTIGDFQALLKAILVDGYGAKAAAGWTRPFTDGLTPVKKAVYRPGAGPMNFLRVTEVAATTVRGRMFETMSDVDTGTNGSPAGLGNGDDIAHPPAISPIPWMCVADSRTMYLFLREGSLAGQYKCLYFGQYFSYLTADAFSTVFASDPAGGGSNVYAVTQYQNKTTNANSFMRIQRGYPSNLVAGVGMVGGGALAAEHNVTHNVMRSSIPYPNPIDGKLWIAPLLLSEPAVPHIRGRLRGLWKPMHILTTLADQDTFTGTGSLAGKTFMLVQGVSGTTPAGTLIVEISDTWP